MGCNKYLCDPDANSIIPECGDDAVYDFIHPVKPVQINALVVNIGQDEPLGILLHRGCCYSDGCTEVDNPCEVPFASTADIELYEDYGCVGKCRK